MTCSKCGYTFQKNASRMPCPECKGLSITFDEHIELNAEAYIMLGLRQRRPGIQGWIVDTKNRIKKSRHDILARELLVIDRSANDKTVKTHRVEERQNNGSWEVVHEHTDESKAKRR